MPLPFLTSRRSRTPWTPRRRRGAAVQLVLGGLLLMAVPAFLGESAIAAGFRGLAPVAWLMAVAGAVMLLWRVDAPVRGPSASRSGGSARRAGTGTPGRPGDGAPAGRAAPRRRAAVAPVARAVASPERYADTEIPFEDPSAVR